MLLGKDRFFPFGHIGGADGSEASSRFIAPLRWLRPGASPSCCDGSRIGLQADVRNTAFNLRTYGNGDESLVLTAH